MEPTNTFLNRHIGPRASEIAKMLKAVGVSTLDELINQTLPETIRHKTPLAMAQDGMSEYEYLNSLKKIAKKNKIYRSFIGQGYY